QDR
ncbi:hypothetical protein D043_0517B, partial [Vibrio parahaemolyticus EKP-021]